MLLIPLHLENWSSVFCLYARQLIMRSSWPFFYKHSILVGKLINKSWLLDMFVRKNQSQKKNKRNLKSFQVDCDNCDHGFFWPWSVPSQGRSWGESLEWLTSKKGLGYGLEGLTTFCFFFWFCLILFVQAANTLGRADLEFRSTRTSALSLIEKAMVAGDPKAHECHQYHFKAFPK